MKILWLTYDLPYPLISGGKVRAYHLIKNLSRNHQITLFSYYRDEEQRQYLPELRKYCQEIYLFKRRKPWSWQNLWRCFLTPLPFTAAVYYSPPLKKALIQKLGGDDYDLVHFESFYPALYLPLVKRLGFKAVMGNENIEYRIYDRYADSRKFFLLRWLLKLEVFRMRLFEERLWRQADVNLALSEKEAAVVKKTTKGTCPIIPNGVSAGEFIQVRHSKNRKKMIFIGTLIYQANSEAVRFFLKEIYPEIKKQTKKMEFLLFSWYRPGWIGKYLADPSIKFIQDKETPACRLLPRGDILVAPMRIASGTNIKVLEAMACGLPVVTTSVGIEGIEAKDGKEAIVCDDPGDFADEVVKLLGDKKRRQELGKAGRVLVEELYDWTKISKRLERAYQRLISKKR